MPRKIKSKALRRAVLIMIAVFILFVAVGAAILCVVLRPYATATMDMTLLSIPRESTPSTLYVYSPQDRANREGDIHEAPGGKLSQVRPIDYTPFSEMPEHLINAFVAIEDKRFWRHRGVDMLRTARAALRYLGGNPTFGGSTITQQLIKNLTGEDDFTPERKLTEIFRAMDLERKADKKTILETYLNIINLARGCRGVGAAAEVYFSKSVSDLTLPECATIAAITNNPAKYDPLTNPDATKVRRDLILRRMAEEGYITFEACIDAQASPLKTNPCATQVQSNITSWYADMVVLDVIHDLMERKGYSYAAASLLVYNGGLRIETVMDENLQAIVEAYYEDVNNFPEGERGRPASAFILLDPQNGDVLAVAGAVGNKQGNRLQSYATDTRRPAGSCIKPLTVFTPAVMKGIIQWNTLLDDKPLTTKNGRPWPANADGRYRGTVTAADALAHSLNPVAVTLLEEVGVEYSYEVATKKLGLSGLGDIQEATVSSLALGQQNIGVTLRELTSAYSVFYDGNVQKPRSYHRVLDREGKVLLENSVTATPVCTQAQAALLTRFLMNAIETGTAQGIITKTSALGISIAGKTGTTQNNCDRRFIGYTPRLLGGVWMGYDYPAEMTGIQGNPCIRIWDDMMASCENAYRGAPFQTDFPIPSDLVISEYCPLSGERPNPFCSHPLYGNPLKTGWFIKGTEPREDCTYHAEPPVHIHPDDATDPDRIPLFPHDLCPDTTPPSNVVPRDTPKKESPIRRWFRFFRA
ncbi:MAG: transglycosylase domain-containing protein [Clostridia bacterium]|nr:transglycosylase domain-containing protein [Clostridia bacterium]